MKVRYAVVALHALEQGDDRPALIFQTQIIKVDVAFVRDHLVKLVSLPCVKVGKLLHVTVVARFAVEAESVLAEAVLSIQVPRAHPNLQLCVEIAVMTCRLFTRNKVASP